MPRPIGEIFDGVPLLSETANTTFDIIHYWQGELLCDNPPSAVKWEEIAES
jgi:hypothetical protein